VGWQRPRDRVEQVLERDQMVQRMVRDRGIEWGRGFPDVDVASVGPYLRHAGRGSLRDAALDHRSIDLQRVDDETIAPRRNQRLCKTNLQIARARADADEAALSRSRVVASR